MYRCCKEKLDAACSRVRIKWICLCCVVEFDGDSDSSYLGDWFADFQLSLKPLFSQAQCCFLKDKFHNLSLTFGLQWQISRSSSIYSHPLASANHFVVLAPDYVFVQKQLLIYASWRNVQDHFE